MNESTRHTLMGSNRMDWRTPVELMRKITLEFGPLFDVSDRHYSSPDGHSGLVPTFDAFWDPWPSHVYLNPPYGREQGRWVHDAARHASNAKGNIAVVLIPSRTDTALFDECVVKYASLVRFYRGRLHFDDGPNAAPFPSMLVVFRWPAISNGSCHFEVRRP